MNLILRQVIGYQQGLKKASTSASPLLKKQLENAQKQLNQILNKWKFGDAPLTSAEEFLNNFEPWINRQLEQQKEWKVFLAKKGVNDLKEAETKLANRDLSKNEELEQVRQELAEAQQKHEQELAQQEQTWNNTEADYLRRIEELKASPGTTELSSEDQEKLAEYDDLITERDEAIREKRTLEQSILALNNRLNLKQQEINHKEKSLDQLKKEKSQTEIAWNNKLQAEKLMSKGSLERINLLTKEHEELKKKYSKQGQLLDTEQLECKRLEEENENLKAELAKLKGAK